MNKGKAVVDTTVTAAMLDDNKTTIKKWNWPSTRKWDYTAPVKAKDRKSTRLNSSHESPSRMPSSA